MFCYCTTVNLCVVTKPLNLCVTFPILGLIRSTLVLKPHRSSDADEDGELADQKEYQSMIGFILYMMVTRPDIQFSVCLCARFQTLPRTSHR
jgi:hypothetical protein